MLKRLRIPTYFLILSSVDLRWEELSHIIKRLYNLGLSDEGLTDLSYQERCNLLHKNPVLAAKHFKEKVEVIFKDIIVNGPLCKKKKKKNTMLCALNFKKWVAHIFILLYGFFIHKIFKIMRCCQTVDIIQSFLS